MRPEFCGINNLLTFWPLISPEPNNDSPLNPEAAQLWNNERGELNFRMVNKNLGANV